MLPPAHGCGLLALTLSLLKIAFAASLPSPIGIESQSPIRP